MGLIIIGLLILLAELMTVSSAASLKEDHTTDSDSASDSASVHRYNVCNGLSNQLLYHSAEIASAIQQGKRWVEIPNYYIVNGVQHSDANVLPSESNSVPFEVAFDKDFFLRQVQQLGIQAKLVQWDLSKDQMPCAGMESFQRADPHGFLMPL